MATAVRVGAHFLLLPAVLLYLSPHEQATWWVFVALGNFANLADFGFSQGISRVYSFLWAGAADFQAEGLATSAQGRSPNYDGVWALNRTVRHLYVRLALIAFVLLGIGGTAYLFKAVAAEQPTNLWWLWGMYLVAVGFNFGTSQWLIACQGINCIRQMHLAYLVSGLAYVFVAISGLSLGYGLAAMVAATFVRAIVQGQIGRMAFYKAMPAATTNARPDFSMLRKLWPNARKFGILSIGGYLQANGHILLSRYFLGAEVTAAVGLTTQMGSFLMNFSALWLNVKWAEITILRVQGRLHEMASLFARRLLLVFVTFLAFATVVILSGNTILEWRNASTRLLPLPFLVVYFLYLGQQLFYIQFGMLTFTENVIPFFKIGLLTGLAIVLLSAVLTPIWGLWGLIVAPLIAELAYSAWFTVRRGFSGQPLSCRDFLRVAVGKTT